MINAWCNIIYIETYVIAVTVIVLERHGNQELQNLTGMPPK